MQVFVLLKVMAGGVLARTLLNCTHLHRLKTVSPEFRDELSRLHSFSMTLGYHHFSGGIRAQVGRPGEPLKKAPRPERLWP